MMQWSKTFLLLILAGLFLLAGAYVGAQEKAPAPEKGIGQMAPPTSPEGAKEPPYTKPYPMGFVSIELKHIGAGVGLESGNGLLTYKGKQYTFKVKGLQIGTVGISKLTAKGEVYKFIRSRRISGAVCSVGGQCGDLQGEGRARL